MKLKPIPLFQCGDFTTTYTQRKLGANKRQKRIFVINFRRNFRANFVVFVLLYYLPDTFYSFNFLIFLFSAYVRLSAQSEQVPNQKLLFSKKHPRHLIGHLRY